jgi:hypothetical protein
MLPPEGRSGSLGRTGRGAKAKGGMMGGSKRGEGFDGAAAVTRSLLGYGMLAGAFYLVVGVALAATRQGFSFAEQPLSVLMLGDHGWMQRTNIIITGAMVGAAAVGFARALRGSSAARTVAALLATYGACLVLSGVFPPDPMAGFPPGSAGDEATLSGILHLAFGGIGFLALAGAAVASARWFVGAGLPGWATRSRIAAGVIVLTFLGGAALATQTAGVVLLWVAVVVGWAWLAGASLAVYRTVPHPDADRREAKAA